MLKKFLFPGWILIIISLFLYSFTQIDLGLTLTKISVWQIAQKFFQQIGYFDRPLSTVIYSLILVFLFSLYFVFLKLAKEKKVQQRTIIYLSLFTGILLLFSYNAFSYDLFNYIFDAKIITYYNKNPYEFKALDFPGDPMLSFMHWTHRTLPYGPTWLLLTVPLSYAGLQFFLPTFFLFKGLAFFSYISSIFLISRISRIVNKENEIFNIVFFALNPLVVIEGLVSGHNDIVVIFFSLLSIYLLLCKKYVRSILLLLISVGIKYSSVFLLPVYAFSFYQKIKKKNMDLEKFFLFSAVLMMVPTLLASFRTNYQPWYLLNIIPFAAIISKKYYISVPIVIISLFSLFHYIPFLYLGNWDKPVPSILFWLSFTSFALSMLFVISWILKKNIKLKTILK